MAPTDVRIRSAGGATMNAALKRAQSMQRRGTRALGTASSRINVLDPNMLVENPFTSSMTKVVQTVAGRSRTAVLPDDEDLERSFDVAIGDGSVSVQYNLEGQATLSWTTTVSGLRPGRMNFYRFPVVEFDGPGGQGTESAPPLRDDELDVLRQLVLALVQQHKSFLLSKDFFGATAVLGLAMANTDEALALLLEIFRMQPASMLACHGGTRGAQRNFTGENCLHILIVNSREAALLEVVELAVEQLDRRDCIRLFCSKASGAFFADPPMLYYGGTPFSYAVAFSLVKVLEKMLQLMASKPEKLGGVFNPNNGRLHSGALTGFLPLHVSIANGLTKMYDFLTTFSTLSAEDQRILQDYRASPKAISMSGIAKLEWAHLTPLQLAVKLGNKRMVQHVLRKGCGVFWKWGPVTCYELDLTAIDSCNCGGNDVMELVGRPNANPGTQALLLDDFMQGFLHTLFVEKWHRYAKAWYRLTFLLDAAYLALLLTISLALKYDARYEPQPWLYRWLPLAMLFMGSVTMLLDLRVLKIWLHNYLDSPEMRVENQPGSSPGGGVGGTSAPPSPSKLDSSVYTRAPPSTTTAPAAAAAAPGPASAMDAIQDIAGTMSDLLSPRGTMDQIEEIGSVLLQKHALRSLFNWSQQFHIPFRLLSVFISAGSMVAMLLSVLERPDLAVILNQTHLAAPGYHAMTPMEKYGVSSNDTFFAAYEHLCVPLALSLLLYSISFVEKLLVPHQRVGVLWRSVVLMVANDITTWFKIFFALTGIFGMSMFISFPVTGWGYMTGDDTIPVVSSFNHPISSLASMLQLGLMGAELELELTHTDELTGARRLSPFFTESTTAEIVGFLTWVILYITFLFLTVVVLLNLLIAMMSTTYAACDEQSTLRWRVDFSRLVLKTELECAFMAEERLPFWARALRLKRWDLHAGNKVPAGTGNRYVFHFKHVAANAEGFGQEGGKQVFDEPEVFDEGLE